MRFFIINFANLNKQQKKCSQHLEYILKHEDNANINNN